MPICLNSLCGTHGTMAVWLLPWTDPHTHIRMPPWLSYCPTHACHTHQSYSGCYSSAQSHGYAKEVAWSWQGLLLLTSSGSDSHKWRGQGGVDQPCGPKTELCAMLGVVDIKFANVQEDIQWQQKDETIIQSISQWGDTPGALCNSSALVCLCFQTTALTVVMLSGSKRVKTEWFASAINMKFQMDP